jgi:transposase
MKHEKAFPNQVQFDEKELELRRLRSRVAELEKEREILKKQPRFSPKESRDYAMIKNQSVSIPPKKLCLILGVQVAPITLGQRKCQVNVNKTMKT